MTLKGIAEGLKTEISLNQHAYNMIQKSYENAYERGLLKLQGMTKERKKMAYLPAGAKPLPNIRGTAPGVHIVKESTQIFILPGVPMEMKAMFNSSILPILKREKRKYVEKGFYFSGIGESQIAPYITKLEKEHPKLWIKTHPKVGLSVQVEVSVTCFDHEDCQSMVNSVLKKIEEIVIKLNGKIVKN